MLARNNAPTEDRQSLTFVECTRCYGSGEQALGRFCCGGQGCDCCSQGAPHYLPFDCEQCDGTGEVTETEE